MVCNSESILESEFGLTSVTKGPALTSLASALQSAASSMTTRHDLQSAYSVLATAAPNSVIQSISASGFQHIYTTAPPAWFTKLPGDVQTQFLSGQSVLDAVATSVLKVSSTATSNPGVPTATQQLAVAGAAVVGILGVVALL